MKRPSFIALLLASMVLTANAQGPDAQYVQIYSLIQQADLAAQQGQLREATRMYLEAQGSLTKLQTIYPNWNDKVVGYRMSYLKDKIAALPALAEVTPQVSTFASPIAPQRRATETNVPRLQMQVSDLARQVDQLQSERQNLEAKLKEALALRGSAPSGDLTKAEERITVLEKEKELLKVALEQAKAKSAAVQLEAPSDSSKVKALEADRADLQKKLEAATRDSEGKQSSKEKDTRKLIAKLEEQREDLQKKLDAALKEKAEVARNAEKAEKTDKSSGGWFSRGNGDNKEVAKLKARLQTLEAKPLPYSAEELALLNKPAVKLSATAQPTPTPATSAAEPAKKGKELPPGSGALVAEAEKAFASKQYDVAEKKYLEVLRQDENNVYSLANLGAIQLEMNRMEDAEKNVQKALKQDAKDGYSLTLLGIIKFRQNKFDEALDVLSQSAQVNPNNAETQNYLGITLSQKGQRVPAEAALRRALQIQPNYGSAHQNLAVVYATQKPPFLELARWHYGKAVALGETKNVELEKLLNP